MPGAGAVSSPLSWFASGKLAISVTEKMPNLSLHERLIVLSESSLPSCDSSKSRGYKQTPIASLATGREVLAGEYSLKSALGWN